jgi:hypothetical protein
MAESTVLTRRELYDLVWAIPLSRLSEQFGISDRGLAKICERHRVPSPPRGYWAKREAGDSPKQTLFVEVRDAALDLIEINPSASTIPEEAREILTRAKLERRTGQPVKLRPVAPRESTFPPPERVHPILVATAKALRTAKTKETTMIALSGAGLATIWVSSESVERILAFLDKLVRQLFAKEYVVEVVAKGIKVSLAPDDLVFTLKEQTELHPHEPTQEERLAEKRRQERIAKTNSSWEFWDSKCAYPANDEIGTGHLILQVDGYSDGVRRRWADGKSQTLETLFDGIVAGFEALLATRKAKRLEMEE